MLAFFLHILGYDLWFYASHILLHQPAFYWIHKTHHKARHPTFSDTYRGHWSEGPLQSLGILLPLLILPLDPCQLAAAAFVTNTRGILRHDARTSWIDGGHHLKHHLHFNANYGEPWLDWVFGTNHKALSQAEP